MSRRRTWLTATLLASTLALAGCSDSSSSDSSSKEGPAKLVEVDGSDVKRVVLTEQAAKRLDIQVKPVTEQGGSQVVPYASVVYAADGGTWVFSSPEPLVYVRAPITVTSITGDQAILSAGPGPGTPVVTVGTAELFGTEQEIGQDGGH